MYEKYLEKLTEEGLIRNRKEGTIQTYTANVNKFLNWANKNPEELTRSFDSLIKEKSL